MNYTTTTKIAFTVPRRRGWHIIWAVFRETVAAYLHRDKNIEFSIGEVNR